MGRFLEPRAVRPTQLAYSVSSWGPLRSPVVGGLRSGDTTTAEDSEVAGTEVDGTDDDGTDVDVAEVDVTEVDVTEVDITEGPVGDEAAATADPPSVILMRRALTRMPAAETPLAAAVTPVSRPARRKRLT
jgi:hypothetical protein